MGRGLAAMLVTAAVGAVLVAATGVAAVKTKSASIELDAGERGSVTAECKRRSRVVSGGFDVDTDDLTRVPVSKREGKRGWTTTATPSGLDPATLTTYAYCDRSAPRLKARSATVPVAGPVTNVSVMCKRGSEVFAGGFESDGESFPVTSMRAGKRTWTATGNTFPDTSLTAFAYCDRSQPGLKTKSETEQLGSFELGSATAKCKRGTTAVSGGFDSPDPEVMAAGFPGPLVLVNESRREGKRRWTATGTAGFGGGSLTVYAYCEKKRNK